MSSSLDRRPSPLSLSLSLSLSPRRSEWSQRIRSFFLSISRGAERRAKGKSGRERGGQGERVRERRERMNALCGNMSNLSMRCASTERRKINTNATRLVKSNAPTAVTQGGRQRTTSRGRRTPLHIVAARVAGVEIPNAKNVEVSHHPTPSIHPSIHPPLSLCLCVSVSLCLCGWMQLCA